MNPAGIGSGFMHSGKGIGIGLLDCICLISCNLLKRTLQKVSK